MSNAFVIGRGSKVTVALLPYGSRAPIVPQTITVGATPAAANATSVTVEALTEPIEASPDSPVFLAFEDATDGSDRFVKVIAPAADGATTLTVETLKRGISPASKAIYPTKLQARTSADLGSSSNNVTTTTFDSGGYNDGVIAQIGRTISANGNYLPLDAGYRTCLFAFEEFREVWLSLHLPTPGGYTSGYIFSGAASVTDAPLTVPADGIIAANLNFEFRGKVKIGEPK